MGLVPVEKKDEDYDYDQDPDPLIATLVAGAAQ